ncbi:autotransporter domain-containing protein [Streptobacillus ratti]|uniref:autotransporter domain-containing protein n=1 Tax=Streptobacillus ratti TaxID=1720557 RepID=UPI0009349C1A|nr:autotransporter domain-containing protein [Streptobacillus ratti]
MSKKLYILSFISLISILVNAETIDDKINEDIKKINEIEKKIKYDSIIKNLTGKFHLKNDEKASIEINNNYTASDENKIYSEENDIPNSLKLINNGRISIEGMTRLIVKREDYSNLVYVINNNIIESNSSRKIEIGSKYAYFKNSRKGIFNSNLSIDSKELSLLDNGGKMIGDVSVQSEKNVTFINRKTGILSGDLMLNSTDEGSTYFKNEGKICEANSDFALSYGKKLKFVNTGIINTFSLISKITSLYNDEGTMEDDDINNKVSYYLNTKNAVIKSKYFDISAGKINFRNFGYIELVKDRNNQFHFEALTGLIENNGIIKGDINTKFDGANYEEERIKKFAPLRINLQNGMLEGNLKLERVNSNETITTIKSLGNVTGVLDSTEGDNDTLRLIGKDTIDDVNKFKDFEKTHLQNADWTFKNGEYKTNNEILVENSKLNINKGQLKTKKFTNDKTSTINVLENSSVKATEKFTNKGIISFLKNKNEIDTFNLKGNYVGDNGTLSMRTYIDNNNPKSDIFKVDGNVTGKTGVNILSPDNTLMYKRTKEKLKLIETTSSTQDAFNLLNPEHGVFKYSLGLEDNKWYLKQEYNKPVIATIINSMEKARNEFNLSYNDHDKERLWTKLSNISGKNTFTNNRGYNLNIDSNIINILVGYDIKQNNIHKYGIFGNIGFINTIKGESNLLGLGLYNTWNNKHFYIDNWINYNYLQNRIKIKDVFNYGLHSLKGSIEVGTRGDMYIFNNRLHVSLYEQLILSKVTEPIMKKVDGLKYFTDINLRLRLGTNLILYTTKNINPYVEFNWNYDTSLFGVRIEDEDYRYNGKNSFEIKWGLREIKINKKLSLWTNMLHRFSDVKNTGNGVELGLFYKI